MSSALCTTKTSRTAPISQANAYLIAQLSKRPGGLWAPAVAYRPVGTPRQGGGGPNSAIMHMICPKLDMRNPTLDLRGSSFEAFVWKWQRSKVVTVDDHTRAALHDAASSWKPVNREIETFWGARIKANGSHVYTKLVTDEHVHYLFSRHKEEYLIYIQCELAAPEDDVGDDQSPDQSGLPVTSKKRRRGRKGSTGADAKTEKTRIKKSPQQTPGLPPSPPPPPPTKTKSKSTGISKEFLAS